MGILSVLLQDGETLLILVELFFTLVYWVYLAFLNELVCIGVGLSVQAFNHFLFNMRGKLINILVFAHD